MRESVQQRGESLSQTVFSGGPVDDFEAVGRMQLITALRAGLNPWSKLVDIGCGCLRGGYWSIHFLDPHCYCGIEPNRPMLDEGIRRILEPDLVTQKQPRFDDNAQFDTSVFGEKFDFFVARSVWTHASKSQIRAMLDAFVRDSSDAGVFLTSYLRAQPIRFGRHPFSRRDYQGDAWLGRSHESSTPALVYHSFKWIARECASRRLRVRELPYEIYNRQVWLRIERC